MVSTIAAAMAGALLGLGVWVLATGPTMTVPRLGRWRLTRARWIQVGAATAAAVLVLSLTRLVLLAGAVFTVILTWRWLFGSAAAQRRTIAKLEAFAGWVEAVRDTVATASGLAQALPAAAQHVPEVLAEPMRRFRARLGAREPLEDALRQLADDIDDPIADAALGSLILNARVQGRRLGAVLSAQSEATRREVQSRRELEAERGKIRQSTALIMIATVVTTTVLMIAQDTWREAFTTPAGHAMFAAAMALFAGGFAIMRRLGTSTAPDRFLQGQQGRR